MVCSTWSLCFSKISNDHLLGEREEPQEVLQWHSKWHQEFRVPNQAVRIWASRSFDLDLDTLCGSGFSPILPHGYPRFRNQPYRKSLSYYSSTSPPYALGKTRRDGLT